MRVIKQPAKRRTKWEDSRAKPATNRRPGRPCVWMDWRTTCADVASAHAEYQQALTER